MLSPDDDHADEPVTAINVQIPVESMRSIFLEMVYRGDGPERPEAVIATDSGFCYQIDGKDFLVTARHNFTGWDIERKTNRCRHTESDLPTFRSTCWTGQSRTPRQSGWSTHDSGAGWMSSHCRCGCRVKRTCFTFHGNPSPTRSCGLPRTCRSSDTRTGSTATTYRSGCGAQSRRSLPFCT